MRSLLIAILIFVASAVYAADSEVALTIRMPPAPDYVMLGGVWGAAVGLPQPCSPCSELQKALVAW